MGTLGDYMLRLSTRAPVALAALLLTSVGCVSDESANSETTATVDMTISADGTNRESDGHTVSEDAGLAIMDSTMEAPMDADGSMGVDGAMMTVRPHPPAYLGGERPARYYRPLMHDPDVPAPLMILLHGYGWNALGIDFYFQLSDQTRENGILLVVPEGRVDRAGSRFERDGLLL